MPFWTGPRIWAVACLAGFVLAVAFPLPFGARLSQAATSIGLAVVVLSAMFAAIYRPRRFRR